MLEPPGHGHRVLKVTFIRYRHIYRYIDRYRYRNGIDTHLCRSRAHKESAVVLEPPGHRHRVLYVKFDVLNGQIYTDIDI